MLKEEFLLHGVTSSTGGCAVLVVINGPVRREKSNYSAPMDAHIVQELTNWHAVFTGVGD